MSGDLSSGLGLTKSIDIPSAILTSFFPGTSASKPLQNGGGAGARSGSNSGGGSQSTTTPLVSSGGSGGNSGSCSALYGQCGGSGYTGPTCCSSGSCKYSNDWYSQCL